MSPKGERCEEDAQQVLDNEDYKGPTPKLREKSFKIGKISTLNFLDQDVGIDDLSEVCIGLPFYYGAVQRASTWCCAYLYRKHVTIRSDEDENSWVPYPLQHPRLRYMLQQYQVRF